MPAKRDEMMEMEEEEVIDLSNPEVVQKYKAAAEVAHRAMEEVMKQCKAGKRIVELCQAGDNFIVAECKKPFPKQKMERGIAFPTCVSVNNIAGHFSPLKDDKAVLRKGDVIKIDLGAHIDGYLALAARTLVCEPDGDVTGKAADVIAAAQVAMNAAIHMIQVGKTVCTLLITFIIIIYDKTKLVFHHSLFFFVFFLILKSE